MSVVAMASLFRRGFGAFAALLALLIARPAPAIVEHEDERLRLNLVGSAKLFPLYIRTYDTPLAPAENIWTAIGSFRLAFETEYDDTWSFEAAYHLFPIVSDEEAPSGIGAAPGGLVQPTESPLRVVDFDREIDSGDHVSLQHNFDRLNVAMETGIADVRIGRQAISHGNARLFTSTDIFSPFSPATLDNEFKQGIDALRVTVPIGETSEMEAYGVGHRDDLSRGIYLLRARHSFTGLDISLYGGASHAAPTLAADVSGDLAGATLYTELFYRHWTNSTWRESAGSADPVIGAPEPREHSFRATAGVHYFFEMGLSTIFELHFNGPGSRDPMRYPEITLSPEWQVGEIFLLGRYYAGLGLGYDVSDLVKAGLSSLVNLGDPSTLIGPSVSWDSSQNTSVQGGALLGLGKRPDPLPQSEFGLYPYIFYADLRWYF